MPAVTDPTLVVGGCRGSMCVSGPEYRRFGGNTTCFFAEVEDGHHLVVDAGTGLRMLEGVLGPSPHRFTLFLTHYHWDHIQGLPMFSPLFDPANEFVIYGPDVAGEGPEEILASAIRSPWWPITVADATAKVEFRTLTAGSVMAGPVEVRHEPLHHPQGVAAYRLDWHRSIVVATDHEAGEDPEADGRLTELARDAHLLIHDAQYTPEEHRGGKVGWGHSDWEAATQAAVDAGVGQLVLTSHDPARSDDDVDAIRGEARGRFSRTDSAFEGMRIPF